MSFMSTRNVSHPRASYVNGTRRNRYDEVATFLDDAEELLGIYDLHVPDLGLPSAHDFDA